MVIKGAKTAVFSPDDVDGFITVIRASAPIKLTPPSEPLLDSLPSFGGGGLIGKLIGPAIGIVALAVVAFAMLSRPVLQATR